MRRLPLLALAVVPVALPLAVLAASPGRLLPGFPRYDYVPLGGDAYGYYYCARRLFSLGLHDAPIVLAAFVVIVPAAVVVARRSTRAATKVLAAVWALGLLAAVLARLVPFTGAPEFGWPLVTSVALLPFRLVGRAGPDEWFGVALVISIAANLVTVGASYVIARRIGLGKVAAYLGAALVSLWPLLVLLAGHRASLNGTWQDFSGLSAYTEPLSTALITSGLAIVVDRKLDDVHAAWAGGLLGLATLVRVSNVLIAACVLVFLVVLRDRRVAAVYAAAAAAWAPAVLLYWPKGYPDLKPPVFPAHPFALSYVRHAWTDSYLWRPVVIAVILPVALLGIRRAARDVSALLWSCIAATVVFYSFYELTPLHPRFLYAVLPVVLVYWAAGASLAFTAGRRLFDRSTEA